jgi:hypothetical protein
MMMHKNKITKKNLKKGFFWAVTIDTTNKGSRPEIHAHVGEELVKLSNLLAACRCRRRHQQKVPPRHHQQKILAHVDDDELLKCEPIRIRARDRPPT